MVRDWLDVWFPDLTVSAGSWRSMMVSHEKISRGPCGRWDWCRSLDVLKWSDHSLLGGYLVGNVMVVVMMATNVS